MNSYQQKQDNSKFKFKIYQLEQKQPRLKKQPI